jgi:hypothetical protein
MDVIYGSALWYGATKVNCHFVAERLAAERPVLFVESIGAREPSVHEWRRILPRLLRALLPLRHVGPNLWLLSPLPLPLYRGSGAVFNSWWVGLQVRLALALRRWPVEVCWAFHPMGLGTARTLGARGLIYYCVDDHAANPGVDANVIRRMEHALTRAADLTIVTGEPLAERLVAYARAIEVLPNVADTELFAREVVQDHPVLQRLDALPRPRVGYLGNLAAYKIDLELVREIASLRPKWSVVLVGPRNQGDVRGTVQPGSMPPNVTFADPVPHKLAPAVIDRFDVCLLPSAQHRVMNASFPLKFFEYLLRGKPVVARPLPTLAPFRDWFDSAVTPEEFVAAVERRLVDDAESAARRRAFAAAFGWQQRMRRLHRLRAGLVGKDLT